MFTSVPKGWARDIHLREEFMNYIAKELNANISDLVHFPAQVFQQYGGADILKSGGKLSEFYLDPKDLPPESSFEDFLYRHVKHLLAREGMGMRRPSFSCELLFYLTPSCNQASHHTSS